MYMNICVNICYHHDSGTGGMGFIHVSHMFCIALCVCGDVSVNKTITKTITKLTRKPSSNTMAH